MRFYQKKIEEFYKNFERKEGSTGISLYTKKIFEDENFKEFLFYFVHTYANEEKEDQRRTINKLKAKIKRLEKKAEKLYYLEEKARQDFVTKITNRWKRS